MQEVGPYQIFLRCKLLHGQLWKPSFILGIRSVVFPNSCSAARGGKSPRYQPSVKSYIVIKSHFLPPCKTMLSDIWYLISEFTPPFSLVIHNSCKQWIYVTTLPSNIKRFGVQHQIPNISIAILMSRQVTPHQCNTKHRYLEKYLDNIIPISEITSPGCYV